MPQIQIQPGDSVDALATAHGTSEAAILAANPGITDKNKIQAGQTINIPDATGGGTPVGSSTTDSPLGNNTTASGGMMTNLSTALRSALDEAATSKKTARIKALSGNMPAGSDPSVISAAIGLANNGVQSGEDKTYSDTLNAVQATQKNSLDLLKTFASDGSLGDMPDSAVMALSKSAGLDEGTALAWKAKINKANKQDDEQKALTMQNLQLEIQTKQKALTQGPAKDSSIATDAQIQNVKDFYGITLPAGAPVSAVKSLYDTYTAFNSLKTNGVTKDQLTSQWQQDNPGVTMPDNTKALLDKLYTTDAKKSSGIIDWFKSTFGGGIAMPQG